MNQFYKGTAVFCDFVFGGKPLGKAVEVVEPGDGQHSGGKVRVLLTETQGAYKKGETVEVPANLCVPRVKEIALKQGQFFRRINTDFAWVK
jgi:hypothetical protein